jgi:hypothetical protein
MRARVVVRKRPLGQRVEDDGPADGQRAARHDDPCEPDLPGPQTGRVEGHHDGLTERQLVTNEAQYYGNAPAHRCCHGALFSRWHPLA